MVRRYVKRRRGRSTRRAPRRRVTRGRKVVKRRRLQGKGAAARAGAVVLASAGREIYKRVHTAVGEANRRKGGPRKRVKSGKLTEGTGSYSQWTQAYKSAKFGRLTPRKIDAMSVDRSVFVHRRIGPFNDYGQFYLTNQIVSNGNLNFPMMLFELNSCNNFVNGSLQDHAPVRRVYQTNITNQIGFDATQGQGTDGVLGPTQWVTESSAHGTNSTLTWPGDNAIHKWSSLDLELWGCRNKPTKYNVSLVQFSEDVLNDYSNKSGQAAEFWQSLIKHYTYSPLAKMEDGWTKKKMKILKSYTINIDPTANYENDPDPHVKTLKLFYRFNRKCTFNWMYNTSTVQTREEMNEADWRQEANQNQVQVHPNARIYVLVRASNFTRLGGGDTADNTTNPSISWVMKTCYLVSS